jgi:uncharacterized sulfatase
MYATSLGTQRLRSAFPIPDWVLPFTSALREAEYYCSNNVKTDYNFQNEAEFVERAWDDSSNQAHWRNRPAGQPFFSIFNLMTTHQSRTSVWSQQEFEAEVGSHLKSSQRSDPQSLTLPSYYPDTEESRRAWARYRDCISLMDQQVGDILDQLQADGLVDDTIVFFYSDHGMGMPRGKRCLYDSGMRVPLLVRFPAKWSHWGPNSAGASCDRLVSFVDFAPTMLSLCGLQSPHYYQGVPFLGEQAANHPRDYVFGARDRVDEAFDVARSVRDKQWLYIRSYHPHLSWMQPEGYSDASPFRRELQRMARTGQLSANAMQYAAPHRPLEELYDTHVDPEQVRNLASDPNYAATLARMRAELRRWQLETRDAGYLSEPDMWSRLGAGETVWDVAQDDVRMPLSRLLAAAEAVGRGERNHELRQWLTAEDKGVRMWAAIGFNAQSELNEADRRALAQALKDSSAGVRIEAAAALARQAPDPANYLTILTDALAADSQALVMQAARQLQLLGPVAATVRPQLQNALVKAQADEAQGDFLAMYIRFSLAAALDALPGDGNK